MKSLSVARKLQVLFGALTVLIAVQSLTMFRGFSSMRSEFEFAVDHRVALMQGASQFDSAIRQIRGSIFGLLAHADKGTAAGDKKQYAEGLESSQRALTQMLSVAVTPKTQKQLADAKESLRTITSIDAEVIRLFDAGDFVRASEVAEQAEAPLAKCSALSREMVQRQSDNLTQDKAEVRGEETSYSWIMAFIIVGSIVAGVFTLLVLRDITANLRRLTMELARGASQLATASGQISSSSQALAEGASEQAASLEETASSAEEISSMTRQNAENSQSAAESMVATTNRITEGNRRLNELVASMQEISGSSEKISKIIKTIDEIAFHTNILALNASVEAARAGEAGMGFAVVADEVRNLAQRSAQAARETATLIEESIRNAQQGGLKVSGVASAIEAITAESERVKVLIDQVSLGSREQSRGLDQITGAIGQMDKVTQRIAASSEEGASAGQQLYSQSQALQEIVQHLAAFVGAAEHSLAAG
jgi:methyl-accepting chemotaxis protein/methyl-accepting chemotaxis protein-1 (serine sensor receptor)